MLRECGRDKGQTIAIAVCKCIGTRTPTICGTPEGNRFIPVTVGICFVWDVIYIVELKKVGKGEKARTAGPHRVKHFAVPLHSRGQTVVRNLPYPARGVPEIS